MTDWKRPATAAVSALVAGVCFSSVALPALAAERPLTPRIGETLSADAGIVNVFVRLDTDSVASFNMKALARTGEMPDGAAQRAHAARVDAAKAGIRSALSGLGAREFMDLRVGDAGVGVRVDARYLASIRGMPGVKQVVPVRMIKPTNVNSVPSIGAAEVWAQKGYTGEGVSIGIIDTGIDYHHTNFGGDQDYASNPDSTVIEEGTFPTMKVVGGYDFAGICDIGAFEDGAPCDGEFNVEDADPIDFNGHGSHVGGTAAGLGNENIGPGVAFNADLYAIKVFGDFVGGTILTAAGIEWAMDPNGDGDMSDHLDVINMSLGSDLGDPEDPTAVASNAAADVGIVVVTSAGNAGNVAYNLGSPGVASHALAVGATTTAGLEYSGLEVTSGSAAGTYGGLESGFEPVNPRLADTGPVTADVVTVEPFEGCTEITSDVAGKIALISRGTCAFTDKHLNAQAAGAAAVIVYNNQPNGGPIIMGGDGTGITIPSVFISQNDGAALVGVLASESIIGTLTTGLPVPEFDNNMADFSSRGPGMGGSQCKPEISAPGVGIVSTAAQTGDQARTQQGTSMAAPHVAGVAALLKEQYPDKSEAEIRALMLSSTVQAQDPAGGVVPVALQGTGVVNALNASNATAYAETACLSFGRLNSSFAQSRTVSTRVVNIERQPGRTMNVTHVPNQTLPGVSVVCRQNTLDFGSRGNASTLSIRLSTDPSAMPPDLSYQSQTEVDGWCMVEDGDQSIPVAYMAVVDPASDIRNWIRKPGQGRLRNAGPAIGYADGFNLAGAGDEALGDAPNAFEYFGYRTEDYGYPALEFGVSTQGVIETWSRYVFDIEVDADEDGIYETLLRAADESVFFGGDPTGVIVTAIFNDAGGFLLFDAFVDFNDQGGVFRFLAYDAFGAPIGVLEDGDTDFAYIATLFDRSLGTVGVQTGLIDIADDHDIAPSFNILLPGDTLKFTFESEGPGYFWLAPTNIEGKQARMP